MLVGSRTRIEKGRIETIPPFFVFVIGVVGGFGVLGVFGIFRRFRGIGYLLSPIVFCRTY